MTEARSNKLSERQIEVLTLIAEGLDMNAIAETLGISTRTAESHRSAIQKKLGLRPIALLTRFAIREGLVVESKGGS